MIAIVDYKTGNLRSVMNALTRLGAEFVLTADEKELRRADRVILPGVGNAAEAMANLRDTGLIPSIMNLRKPVLGICVGMQIMCRHSDEGDVDCLGIFDTFVKKFIPTEELKVPHTGWNTIGNLESKLFKDIKSGEFVYYVHSYYAGLCPDTIATTRQGILYSAALKYENFYGVQFHPEKSGDTGERILKNFLKL
ncbi:MAG: imidazole glycerol phosphate synthase subunit HisH [Muribaculaceae bacterium]|nr:imidazole glycerol phosphate synthase subunit HisH [Muribaculaceae bacterium]MDE5844395.1 imidazole glycerol phosphate synthase subunit HisH [Muribaculaceae bacterium]MDE7369513.1 imidazole glycerol phosphate synthase subunit HisH [Muribaculaceae bacterium]